MLKSSENQFSKFATRKWYVVDSESIDLYSIHNSIKFLTKSIQSDLCNCCDAYILVIKNIVVARADNNTKVAFKNCAAFRKCKTEKNDTLVDEAEFIDIAMPMYNLIEYSDNYSETSGRLRQFKRYEIEGNVDLTVHTQHIPNNSLSFKNKSNIITDRNGVKIAVPLKNLSNFSRSIEMPLINCKVEFNFYDN